MIPSAGSWRAVSAEKRIGIAVNVGGAIWAEVRLQEGETVENALRRFKRQVIQENIIGEVERHSIYLKSGQKLRVKQALASKRNRRKARREPD
jgi:small subunit ribosomal protein S21